MRCLIANLQKVKADITELDPLGELGHGTCGYVIKMRHRKTNTLMAVKVSRAILSLSCIVTVSLYLS